MKIKELIKFLENFAPLYLQEEYDNCGLTVGEKNNKITKILTCVDVTLEVIKEAKKNNCNLIISHHPVIFEAIKKINNDDFTEKIIFEAIKNNIALYAMHTNLDNILNGVNSIICKKLKIKNTKILLPKNNTLKKIITFCPEKNTHKIRTALFKAGGGAIGDYDSCSFITTGEGSFRPLNNSNPFVGEKGEIHKEKENKIEIIFPAHKEENIIKTLLDVHPYEEVAYYIHELNNTNKDIGSGMIGELEKETKTLEFIKFIKKTMKSKCIRHTNINNKKIKKVAVCGGSGGFLIEEAIKQKAEIFITGEIKYHDFFKANDKIILIDIGHFESERYTTNLIYEIIKKNFSKLAILKSNIDTNPISYII